MLDDTTILYNYLETTVQTVVDKINTLKKNEKTAYIFGGTTEVKFEGDLIIRARNVRFILDDHMNIESSDPEKHKVKSPYRAYKDRKPDIYKRKGSCGCASHKKH